LDSLPGFRHLPSQLRLDRIPQLPDAFLTFPDVLFDARALFRGKVQFAGCPQQEFHAPFLQPTLELGSGPVP